MPITPPWERLWQSAAKGSEDRSLLFRASLLGDKIWSRGDVCSNVFPPIVLGANYIGNSRILYWLLVVCQRLVGSRSQLVVASCSQW